MASVFYEIFGLLKIGKKNKNKKTPVIHLGKLQKHWPRALGLKDNTLLRDRRQNVEFTNLGDHI